MGCRQVRIAIDGMEITIGTSLVAPGASEAVAVADRLNCLLGWTRENWTGFAAGRL